MIKLVDRFHCTGCAACANVCSHNAITMEYDEEGFLQPHINYKKCVECGLCVKSCPQINPIEIPNTNINAYALINKKDRSESSSGGAFSAFARVILKDGGVVFGASIDFDFKVKHIFIESVQDLYKLRGSKYIQSNIGNSYKEVRQFLRNQRKVLFSGTPCQIAGLYNFLGKKRYEGLLITLDLVCHGVPSQGCFDSYITKLQELPHYNNKIIEAFRFRKLDSWSRIPAVKFAKSKWKRLDLYENAYMNAFFEGITFRESCFNCSYCNTKRVGTFTIADFWGIGCQGKKFTKNVAAGVSLVIDNCGTMAKIYEKLSLEAYIEKRSLEEAIVQQANLKAPMIRSEIRDQAVKMMIDPKISLIDFSKKCGLPYRKNLKYLLTRIIKDIIDLFGLYNIYKTISYKIGKTS